MSLYDADFAELRIRIPSRRRTLGDASRLERNVLLILRDVFPDAYEWIATGEPNKPIPISFEDEKVFTDTIVKLRKTNSRSRNHNPESLSYNADSVPHLSTTKNGFYTPSPRNPLRPHPDDSVSWSVWFSLGRPEGMYEHVNISFPSAVAQSRDEAAKVELLLERLIIALGPEDARFAVTHFDRAFWKVHHRIGWLTYFSQPSICEHLLGDFRVRPFHHGVILKLSDDPKDMLRDQFVKQSFEFCQSLIPYWPPQLEN
ncbi:hypothetical protein K7957_09765 [Sphingomonas yunnanensis]|uniref:hypothetical protein n=1 Tax=Sphingomonas yunnanensis TaxID=310400 RepID=UPI001CA79627|nr:hypothetical protein [Sphingomonas yunnanensis]MBY9063221.1 hypothetical protein [Sphingomonas yunnanensis]